MTPLRYEQEILDDVNDGLVVGDISDYHPADITAQLVDSEAGRRIDLMLGGGRASWLPRNQTEADTRRVGNICFDNYVSWFLPVSVYFECYRVRWDYDTYDWNCERWDNRIELPTKLREIQFHSRSLL